MGCGSWTPHDWDSYSKSSIAGKSAAGIYTSKMMKAEFDPKDIPVRESRDSADHPSSNAIIIGLDVTGSWRGSRGGALRHDAGTRCCKSDWHGTGRPHT